MFNPETLKQRLAGSQGYHDKHTKGRLREGVCYQPGGLHLRGVSNLIALSCDDKISQRSPTGQAKRASDTVNSPRWVRVKQQKKVKKKYCLLILQLSCFIMHKLLL
jgi:hypothetical protein